MLVLENGDDQKE